MIHRYLLAIAVLLCACEPSGSRLPETQPGAQPPSRQSRVNVPQANLSEADRQELDYLIGSRLHESYRAYAPGFAQVMGAEVRAPLQPGTDFPLGVDLERGVAYRIVSACDNECDDLDLELIDSRTGGVVADAMGEDRAHNPIIDFTPASDGRHIIRVMLQRCSVGPCYAGAMLVAFDTRPPSVEGVVLPAAAPRGPEGDFADELQLRPIFDYLKERYARDFNITLDTASRLRAGEDIRTEIHVDASEPQVFIGACDRCSNLDLEVIDKSTGAVVVSDTAANNHPVRFYMPAADGEYIVRAIMRDCPDACAAGTRVMWGDVVLARQTAP
jgi:hypothetical protein